MMKIPLFKIYWDDDDVHSVTKTIKKGSYWADGPNIKEFERIIADFTGNNYCITFNSGTSALHATLLAYGFKPGDEIIVPSFTFISTANSTVFIQAKPVFGDIERETFGLDPDLIQEKITKKTRAIIPVHYGGCPCKINELRQIADDNNLVLIEDAAEALGAKIGQKKVGTFGDSAMFSFCQNKIITTGEGGAITTDSKEIFDNLNLIRSHGRETCANYFTTSEYLEYVKLGYNFRISDITASLGISQMKKVDSIIAMRQKNAQYLSKGLESHEFIKVHHPPADYSSVHQLFTIELKGNRTQRDDLIKLLEQHHISSKVYFYPVHLTKFYRDTFGCSEGMLPVTEEISDRVLTLPMYPTLTKEEMDYMIDILVNWHPV